MTASEFLKEYQRLHSSNYELLRFAPRNVPGATDIDHLPEWLINDSALLSDTGEKSHDIYSLIQATLRHNWVKSSYMEIHQYFTDELKDFLKPSERFDLGHVVSSDLDGITVPIPPALGEGHIIVLPSGTNSAPKFLGDAINFLISDELRDTIVSGCNDIRGIKEPHNLYFRRRSRWQFNKITFGQRYTKKSMSLEINGMLQRYSNIGIADMTLPGRDFMRTPLHGEDERVGHPMEFGACLNTIAIHFFLLHECSHVLFHGPNHTGTISAQELEADEGAINLAIEFYPTATSKDALILSSIIILRCVQWLEFFEKKINPEYPSASVRIKNILSHLPNIYLNDNGSFKKVIRLAGEIDALFSELFHLSSWAREPDMLITNGVEIALKHAMRENKNIFKDQMIRWLIFGLHDKLSLQLAQTRVKLEQLICAQVEDEELFEEIALISWVYETIEKNGKEKLIQQVNTHYQKMKAIMKTNRTLLLQNFKPLIGNDTNSQQLIEEFDSIVDKEVFSVSGKHALGMMGNQTFSISIVKLFSSISKLSLSLLDLSNPAVIGLSILAALDSLNGAVTNFNENEGIICQIFYEHHKQEQSDFLTKEALQQKFDAMSKVKSSFLKTVDKLVDKNILRYSDENTIQLVEFYLFKI